MKKFTILLLAVVLAACGAPAPAAPAEQAVAPAPAEPIVITVVVEPTQAPVEPVALAQAPAEPAAEDGTVALDNALGNGVFVNMTMSSSAFTLRCFPRDITFDVTTSNIDIKDVVFYYRTADLKRLYPSEWRAFGNMSANGNGNFTLTFSGEDIHPNLRIDGSYFDFQFVGLAKSGDVVDRSQKIESLVQFTYDCP